MLTEWLAPLPEEKYLRILYVGKLQIISTSAGCEEDISTSKLEDMINDIWSSARVHNVKSGISGHLSWTRQGHVAQLMEGREENVLFLMSKIRADPRVVISKEFRAGLQTMNLGWHASMCYSFQITTHQYCLIDDKSLTLEQMFNRMKETYIIRRGGLKLSEFYKTIVDTVLLKYISIEEKVRFRKVLKNQDMYFESKEN